MADEYATLRAAFHAGATIQAWHLNEGATTSADGRWDDLGLAGGRTMPEFGCPVHLYRIAPDDELWVARILLEQQVASLEPQA